jgi:AcrR family transcriptional regulator
VTRYESVLRAEQAEQTRERIVDGVVDELVNGSGELTMAGVAERARVSVRTVYRHFPTRQALADAVVDRYDHRFGAAFSAPLDDLPRATAAMVRMFAADEELATAIMRLDPAAASPRREAKQSALARTLAPLLKGRSAAEKRRAVAALYAVQGLLMWQSLRRYSGLGVDEASDAVEWMTEAMLDALRREAP